MTLTDLVSSFTKSVVTSLVSLAIAVAVAAFFYGIARYIWGIRNGEEKKISEGNKFILWSLIALFVMLSTWGIIKFVQGVFSIDGSRAIVIPKGNLNSSLYNGQ